MKACSAAIFVLNASTVRMQLVIVNHIGCTCDVCYMIGQLGPVPVAARSNAQVFGRSSTEIVGSNPTGGVDDFLL